LVKVVRDSLERETFKGSVEGVSLVDLLQLMNLGKKTVAISVERSGDVGTVYLEDGEVAHAKSKDREGIDAFNTSVSWRGGNFSTKIGAGAPKKTISEGFNYLLMEAMRLYDEAEEEREQAAANKSPPPEPEIANESEKSETENKNDQKTNDQKLEEMMAKVNLDPLTSIDGFIGACVVDSESGMVLGLNGGGPGLDLEIAAAGNTQVVRAKRKTMKSLKLADTIEDILISLQKQYHIIRPLENNDALFIYVALDREKSNLAMARHEIRTFEKSLSFS
jgi:hypothetical protein